MSQEDIDADLVLHAASALVLKRYYQRLSQYPAI